MNAWLEQSNCWLAAQYKKVLGLDISGGPVRLRWLPADSLIKVTVDAEAHGLAVEDADIGWLLFLLPFEHDRLESQVNQALGLRSRLLRESNYTGKPSAEEKEDRDSTWRVGIVWLVEEAKWDAWQHQVLDLRRESGAVEEISVDAIKVVANDVFSALEAHGLPRLLLHARALLSQTPMEAEKWLSADKQVALELKGFSHQFSTSRARTFANALEERANSFQATDKPPTLPSLRQFRRFKVQHFRNLDNLEIVADSAESTKAQAIVLFGPNGTGKSSLAEAISLAAFETSPRLEQFVNDTDMRRQTTTSYIDDYLTPISAHGSSRVKPCFAWDRDSNYEERPFVLSPDEASRGRFEGVVLNQEDSLKFTELGREELAARVLKGYSALADHLWVWLAQEESRAKEAKTTFARSHGLNASIKLSASAYKALAELLLTKQLQRPSPEFLEWLRFLGRLSGEVGSAATHLLSNWTSLQSNAVKRLAETIARLQERGGEQSYVALAVREKLEEFDILAAQSGTFRKRLEGQLATLRDQLDVALSQIESWGAWLASQTMTPTAADAEEESQALNTEIQHIAKDRTTLEENGKSLRGRLDLLDQTKQFLSSHWSDKHPDTCPVCDSDVKKREGIVAIVSRLQTETNRSILELRARYVETQNRQKELEIKVRALGLSACPLAVEDQDRLRSWLKPFLQEGASLEEWLADQFRRAQLRDDISKMKTMPESPQPYANAQLEADRLASEFISLSQEADKALEDPQAISEVKKEFELRLEKVLKDHLPSTLEKVWVEITMILTTAPWLLPLNPKLNLDQRGKSLSVQAGSGGHYIRYLYNAAERHVLGLAWFFTYYFAKRRFEEAWMLLDDPAQEMDQPSFRELVRFWETLLRIHQRAERPLTMIVALHQEDRALDATRATNGLLYSLGWQKEQQDTISNTSVKRIVLLGPGFHPLKPEQMFG